MSSGLVTFGFATAYQVAMMGNAIRRQGWTDRWVRFYNGLWWMLPANRVVTTDDFSDADFKAADWTHLSAACLGSLQQENPSRFPTCPPPYAPPLPQQPGKSDGGSAAGPGSPSGPPGPPPEQTPGGGSGGGQLPPERPPIPEIAWPALSLEASTPVSCVTNDGTGMASFTIGGSVTLGTTSDPHAQEYYFVTVRVGAKIHVFNMPLGSTRYFDDSIGPVTIGSGAITVAASAVMNHGPGTVIPATNVIIPVPGLCSADIWGFDQAGYGKGDMAYITGFGLSLSAYFNAIYGGEEEVQNPQGLTVFNNSGLWAHVDVSGFASGGDYTLDGSPKGTGSFSDEKILEPGGQWVISWVLGDPDNLWPYGGAHYLGLSFNMSMRLATYDEINPEGPPAPPAG